MATTTRTDTTYSATLLRLHALEEYVQAEIAAVKAQIAALEPGTGGGSGDQDRIYAITVGGAQSPVSGDPQATTIYDAAGTSIHTSVWGVSSEISALLQSNTIHPMISLIGYGAPEDFYTSGSSVFTSVFGDSDMYTAIVGTGAGTGGSIAGMLFGTGASAAYFQSTGKDLYSMIFGNDDNAAVIDSFSSIFSLVFGNEDNPASLGLRSIFGLAFQNDINAASLVTDGKSLWEMIKSCEARLSAGGL